MTTSARVRKRQYDNAVAREKYLADPNRPVKETVSKRPKTSVVYASTLFKGSTGATSQLFSIQASERSLVFLANTTIAPGDGFTDPKLAPLGLRIPAGITDPIVQTPRFWTPAQIHASVGLGTPTAKRSPWGSRVVKSKSASYSAPISGTSVNMTHDLLDARAAAVYTLIKSKLGDLSYSAFYLSPEMVNIKKV